MRIPYASYLVQKLAKLILARHVLLRFYIIIRGSDVSHHASTMLTRHLERYFGSSTVLRYVPMANSNAQSALRDPNRNETSKETRIEQPLRDL